MNCYQALLSIIDYLKNSFKTFQMIYYSSSYLQGITLNLIFLKRHSKKFKVFFCVFFFLKQRILSLHDGKQRGK